ncbi:MAG: hypothetical protein LAT67_00420 [Balneolales bacterium]|nr:hypothetical protein [Balneolales bacterium]
MSGEKSYYISHIIRLIFLPVLLIIVVFSGFQVYNTVYSIIIHGFDSKLSVLATTAGAFVNLEDHQKIHTRQHISGISVDHNGRLYGFNPETGLSRIHTDGSASIDNYIALAADNSGSVPQVRDFSMSESMIFILDDGFTGRIHKYSMDGDHLADAQLPATYNVVSIEYHPDKEILLALAETGTVLLLSPETLQVQDSFETGLIAEYASLTALPAKVFGGHIGILKKGEQFFIADPQKGTTLDFKLDCSTDLYGADCENIKGIVYHAGNDQFFGVSTQLLLFNRDGRADPDFYAHPGFYDLHSELYLSYVEPMRSIRENQNLTYLYTFVLNPDKTISYVLDSSTDENYTHIGYVDSELSEEDYEESRIVMLSGRPYISDIIPWGQWGLIKLGFAPIYDEEGLSSAVMGTDIDVYGITQVSREASIIMYLFSFVFLIISGYVSWLISRKLTEPLEKLKEDVLQNAGGLFDRKIERPQLSDLHPLADLFADASDSLNEEINEKLVKKQDFELKRRLHDFIILAKRNFPDIKTSSVNAIYEQRPADGQGPFAAIHHKESSLLLAWEIPAVKQGYNSIVRHKEIEYTLMQYLNGSTEKDESLSETLGLAYGHIQTLMLNFVCIDLRTSVVFTAITNATTLHTEGISYHVQVPKKARPMIAVNENSDKQISISFRSKDSTSVLKLEFQSEPELV